MDKRRIGGWEEWEGGKESKVYPVCGSLIGCEYLILNQPGVEFNFLPRNYQPIHTQPTPNTTKKIGKEAYLDQ